MPRIIGFQADTNTTSTEKPSETTTMSPFDDPNFIPGDFLDSAGSARFIPEPPVFDLLSDVVKMISEQTTDTWMVVIIVIFGNVIFLIFGISLVATITILAFSQYQDAVFPLNQNKKQKPSAKPQKGKDLQKGVKPMNAGHKKPKGIEPPPTEEVQERKLPRSNKNIPKPTEKTEAPEAQSETEEVELEEHETEEHEPEEPESEEHEPEEPEPEEPEPEDPDEEDPKEDNDPETENP